MKNFFTKAFVCAGVMASALAVNSICTFAATTFADKGIVGTFDSNGNADLTKCTNDAGIYTFGTTTDSVQFYSDKYDAKNNRVKVYGSGSNLITIKTTKASIVEFSGYTSSSGTARTIKNNSDSSNLTFSPSSGFSDATTGETLKATVESAGTYSFSFSGNVQLTGLKMTEKAASTSGKVSLTQNGTGTGNVSVKVGGEDLVANKTYDADTEIILTATPNSDSNMTFTVNGVEESLTDGSFKTKVNGDISIVVTFTKNVARSAITESKSVNFTKNGTGFAMSGKTITTEHFFTMGSGTSLGNDYATVSGTNNGSNGDNGITFNTGDFGGKTAKIKATFASGSDTDERELMLYGGTEALSFGKSSTKKLADSAELNLESNTTYIVSSKSSNMYLSNLTITVEENATTIASTVEKITSNGDYYALDTANNKVYIIHPVKSTDDYKTAEKLVLYNSQSTELAKTAKIYETIQFAEGDTLSISDLNDDTIVGLYAVSESKESPTAPTSATYSWKLEKSAE